MLHVQPKVRVKVYLSEGFRPCPRSQSPAVPPQQGQSPSQNTRGQSSFYKEGGKKGPPGTVMLSLGRETAAEKWKPRCSIRATMGGRDQVSGAGTVRRRKNVKLMETWPAHKCRSVHSCYLKGTVDLEPVYGVRRPPCWHEKWLPEPK